jgi:hypothetical protein
MGKGKHIIRQLVLLPIRLYQYLISPSVGLCCRFYPSCSQYGKEAIEKLGVLRGLILLIWRLARCHPFAKGGVDLVPTNFMRSQKRDNDGL